MISLVGLLAHAGTHTFFNMVVEADFVFTSLNTLLCDGLTTCSWVVELLDESENSLHRHHVRVGAIIGAPFLVDGSRAEDAWEEFVGDTDGRIGLTVFQQNVIPRIVLLDEGILQKKSVFLCIDHSIADIEYLADEYFRFETVHLCMEIGGDSRLEILRLSHIDDGLIGIIELITPRLVW